MTERDALLAAIEASPRDVTRRLVYADHLDESGEPLAAALQRVLAEPEKDDRRLAYADVCEQVAGKVECPRCHGGRKLAGVNREAYTRFPLKPKDLCMVCSGESWVPDGFAARAEFIRVQCELARRAGRCGHIHEPMYAHCPNCSGLRRREAELLTSPNYSEWSGEALRPILVDRIAERTLYGRRDLPERPFEFVRGFVERVTCPAAEFLRHAGVLMAQHPIRSVTLTTWPEGNLLAVERQRSWKKPPRLGGHIMDCWVAEWPGIAFDPPPEAR